MRSHNRTLLGRLGFVDLDRRDPLHDQACRYLSTPPAAERLVDFLDLECTQRRQHFMYPDSEIQCSIDKSIHSIGVTREAEISNGIGKYCKTIGFIDVLFKIVLTERCTNVQKRRLHLRRIDDPWKKSDDFADNDIALAAIEVKTNEVTIGNIIRQINLYRAYSDIRIWILATTYQLSQPQVDYLANARIMHVHLGQQFCEYVKEQAKALCSNSLEV